MIDSTSFRILIVDDEPMLRKSMNVRLSAGGYEVFQAANGKEALESIKQNMPHVIVTDLMMPIMNGAELLTALKSDETTKHIPVIVLSNIDNAENFNSLAGSKVPMGDTKIIRKADMTLNELFDLINQAIALFVIDK